MISSRRNGGYRQRGLALSAMVGVMLSLFVLRAHAQTTERPESVALPEKAEVEQPESAVVQAVQPKSQFSWYAHAELDANYIWRGLYCGGLSLQAEAEVSYYGFFLNTWWNIGTTDWWSGRDTNGRPTTGFNPEVDVVLGYRYKGFKVMFLHMYYFDRYADGSRSRYFDFGNHAPGGGGITTEWRVAYRISDRVPLQLMWCTRTFGRDGYLVNGELKRAYSTYIEVRYDQPLPMDFTLSGVIGMTPWRSMYTGFQKQFAVINLQIALDKSWRLTDYCSVNLGGHITLNPTSMQPLWNIIAGVTFD